jgi:hypothetical protein
MEYNVSTMNFIELPLTILSSIKIISSNFLISSILKANFLFNLPEIGNAKYSGKYTPWIEFFYNLINNVDSRIS